MKSIFSTMILSFSLSMAQAAPPKVGPFPPLDFDPPTAERLVLSNGIVVYVLEDHELPLFQMQLTMRTTPADRPDASAYAYSFLSSQWRVGGTQSRKPDQLNEELEYMPASVETSANEESITISLSCLSRDIDKGMEIFSDVLFNPRFDKKQLAIAKAGSLEDQRRKNDTPTSISRRAFRDVIYGQDHYYSFNLTPEKVKKVKRKQLITLHEKLISPDRAMMSVTGHFKTKELVEKLEALFKEWGAQKRTVPPFNYEIKNAMAGEIFYVEKDFNQSRVYVGNTGISRHDPDQYALAVANTILGGGGSSRLFGEIRSRLGLAYVVGSFYSKPKGPGLVGIGLQTKAPSTVAALKAVETVLDDFIEKEPTQKELRQAKDSIINAFIFQFESKSRIVSEQASLEYFGYDSDYLKNYPANIEKVTAADVQRVAQKYYAKKNRKTVVVGDQAKFDEKLSTLGSVTVIPLDSIE